MKNGILLLVLLSHVSFAQSITGKWENKQFGYSFVFNQNGSYNFDFPAQNMRNLSGTYQKSGNTLLIKNAYGTVNYKIQWVGNQLRLSDAQGTWILNKVGGNSLLDESKFPKIIAQSGTLKLTEEGPKTYETIINLVLDKKVTTVDYQSIVAETKRMFLKCPEVILGDIQTAKESFEQILQNGDPNVIGQFRQAFLGQVYQMAVIDQNPDMQVFWKIFDKYLDVVAFDSKSQLVLTSKDLEAYLNYIDLLAVNQGGQKLNLASRKQLSEQTIANFSRLSQNEKKFLSNADLAYQLTKSNLSRFTAQQTQTFRQQFTPQVQLVQTQQMDADFYQRYSRMMLENHVSIMNGIENLGGTGDYWEIKPSYGW
ncbi:hypothetical protein [Jiulongibacter sediminis]|uniref:Uncharacterized protein n=1 Tax=Jiulongibacter sediminis TaxID=1605367 RepID=A0A0P7BAI4_9BACT|nr:hypothetical protein [Jiulongibacter sediminis]KPM47397.1 hypothetical protein AFM12_14680 [Jiulongibacter sediminis]TBX22977.1 hypothetical protein TK44_14690 [Jiulongibacter sediminis]